MKKWLSILVIAMLAMCLLAACGDSGNSGDTEQDPVQQSDGEATDVLKVAFVYNDVIGDYGWFYGHDKARQESEAALDFLETIYLESVDPGSVAERVIGDLAKEGYDVIVAASADFESDVRSVAPNYPDTKFLVCCGAYSGDNVESFYPKSYQLTYLLGVLAANLDGVDTVGFVGAVNSPMDLQVQNAFLLGAQSVNPDIQQRIIYTNTYYDPAAERDAALSLIDAGVDVICQATNSPAHVQAAEEKGVYAMSMYEDMSQFGANAYVTGEVAKWAVYYIETFQAIHDGSFAVTAEGTKWIDFSTGILDFATFGPMVTPEVKAALDAAVAELTANPDIVWDGPIYDNTGAERVAEGEIMSDADFTSMDWWVKGTITAGGN